jgi:thiol-disulfide isomerase/thioredoxin
LYVYGSKSNTSEMKKTLLLLAVLIAGALYVASAFKNKEIDNSGEADFNYAFKVKDLNDQILSFDEFKGKVVFINLWATWCGPCRYEMPGIEKLYGKVGSDNIKFVMLSIDKTSDQRRVVSYIKNNNYTFPVYMPASTLTEQLNVPSIPTTFILDKKGKIVLRHVGSTNYDTEKYIKLLTDLAKQ